MDAHHWGGLPWGGLVVTGWGCLPASLLRKRGMHACMLAKEADEVGADRSSLAWAAAPQEKRLRLSMRPVAIPSSGCELHATPWLDARSAGVSSGPASDCWVACVAILTIV